MNLTGLHLDWMRCVGTLTAALAVVAVGRHVQAGDAPAPLRVMSFNVRVDVASDGPNAWSLRKEKVASMIRFHRADLVGLQEPLQRQLADLEAALPGFGWFGRGRDADGGGELAAILYRKERLELLEHDTLWLSQTPPVAGSKGWDAAFPRIVTWGKLRDRRTGVVFHHFNTHLDHAGEVARREGARLLLATITEVAGHGPVIVSGDLNSSANDQPWQILTASPGPAGGRGLVDAMSASRLPHHGPTSTWNAFRAIEPERRIDFIFVSSGIEVVSHGILSDTFDGYFPSDHLPVLAEIVLR